MNRAWQTVPAMVGIVALGAALRISLLSGFRFHPDEALYATWARFIASGQDFLLAEHLVDKPPLFLYVLASLFGTLGASEEIARLPNELASAACLCLVYGIGMGLYRSRRVALTATAVLALSPISILFAPTAFTDPFMTMLLLASILAGLRRKALFSGFACGLALATKQDALLFAPLVLILPLVNLDGQQRAISFQRRGQSLLRSAVGLCAPLVLVFIWSALRPQPDFFNSSLANYGGLNLAAPEDYGVRAQEWLQLSRALSSDWLLLLTIVSMPPIVAREHRKVDAMLAGLALVWYAVHVAFMIPTWDRYVLPLSPLSALLVARTLVYVYDRIPTSAGKLMMAAAACCLLIWPAQAALRDEIHVGRDFGVHAGVDQVGHWFWAIDTTATVLYDHDLSWEIDYYTFGRGLDRRWFADYQRLAQDAANMPLARRFVVLAEWETTLENLSAALAHEHLIVAPVFVARRLDGSTAATVYMIFPESTATVSREDAARSGVPSSEQ